MVSRSLLPVMSISAFGLFILGLLAPWNTTKALADPSGDRLGCSTYCQNAGGYGAAGNATPPPPAVTLVSTGTVTADADGYIPVTVKCNLPVQCSGVLIIGGGRSDLLVNAGATRTIGVPMDAGMFASLRSNGPTRLTLTIDAAHTPGAQCADPWNQDCKVRDETKFSYVIPNSLTVAPPR